MSPDPFLPLGVGSGDETSMLAGRSRVNIVLPIVKRLIKIGKCKTWTLDSGLDSWTGLWTEIWTRFWTDAQGNDDHFQETMERRHGATTAS